MKHHGRIHFLEHAGVKKPDLAPAAFLGRGADQRDAPGGVAVKPAQGHGRADTGGGDEVVAASVSDFGQGIVFGQNRDPRA